MYRYYVKEKEKVEKIINYFKEKKVVVYYSEQFTLFKQYQCFNECYDKELIERNFVYLFEWKSPKIKKENLMAL